MAQREDTRPTVFLSSSREDAVWVQRLTKHLAVYERQIALWASSGELFVPTGEGRPRDASVLIAGSSVGVVLLSPAYLSSDYATAELHDLGRRTTAGQLTLLSLVLERCDWEQFDFLLSSELWDHGRPIGELPEGDRRWTEIAKTIARIAIERAKTPSSAGAIAAPFQFSRTARAVLERAQDLARKSQRGGVTSSCLLYGFDPSIAATDTTPGVLGNFLRRGRRYDAAFARFLKDSDGSRRQSATVVTGVTGRVSENVRSIVERAATIAGQVTDPEGVIHARHLFASLIVSSDDGKRQPVAHRRLIDLGIDPEDLRHRFREFVASHALRDDLIAWDSILGTSPSPQPIDERTSLPDTAATQPAAIYERTYSAFVPDRAIYGDRRSGTPLDDSLGVGVHAGHLAQLIAAKETHMPLSIGLFGAWGAGKSHFIDLLDEHLCAVAKSPGNAFHEKIVQIHFNAWHYLDTNLWANLVSEIFDQLFAKLDERPDATDAQINKLKEELARQSLLAAEATEALRAAENARRDAEKKLRDAIKQRQLDEGKVRALLDDLTALALGDDVRKELNEASDRLGLPKLQTSFGELEARAEEMRSLTGRTRALAFAVLAGRGSWRRGLLLVVALAMPLGVAWLAQSRAFEELLEGAGKPIVQIVATIGTLAAWLSAQVKGATAVIDKVENAYDRVKKVRAEREATDDAARAQDALAASSIAEEEARHTLRETEARMKAISAELAELAPGRQLIRFLKERIAATDYRQHLGLVSLVRRDFQQLSDLLTKAATTDDRSLPRIDRIVLYIDDLDRCRAERVIEVLEAVHLLLAFSLFAVVVAVDPRWLRQSLLDHYPRLLGGEDDPVAGSPGRVSVRPATPQDYLEKIFQVPFNLQAMERTGFSTLIEHLFPRALAPSVAAAAVASNGTNDGDAGDPGLGHAATDDDSASEAAGGATFAGASSSRASVTTPSGEPDRASDTAAVAREQSPSLPPDPRRLSLEPKEVEDLLRFQPLFETPRAVKRLANTYCLIRVGVDPNDWSDYLGTGSVPGDYRLPMLMLAVTSAFPSLARPWLRWLRESPPTAWKISQAAVDDLIVKHRDATDPAEWSRLRHSLDQAQLKDWPLPKPDALDKWVPRIARYSF